jgi:hypothetical protein
MDTVKILSRLILQERGRCFVWFLFFNVRTWTLEVKENSSIYIYIYIYIYIGSIKASLLQYLNERSLQVALVYIF